MSCWIVMTVCHEKTLAPVYEDYALPRHTSDIILHLRRQALPNAVRPSFWDGRVILTPSHCQLISCATHHVRIAQRSRHERSVPGRDCAPHINVSTSNEPVMNVGRQTRAWQLDTALIRDCYALLSTSFVLIWDVPGRGRSEYLLRQTARERLALNHTIVHDGTELVASHIFRASVS